MTIPPWIITSVLKALGPKLLDTIFDLIIEWAEGKQEEDKPKPDDDGFPDILDYDY